MTNNRRSPLDLKKVLKSVWGYDAYLPLQQEAMTCAVENRDSIVVLPTGGGKSLCFQAPALAVPGMAVVISPLISLMKDQVDSLLESGVAAARLDSTLNPEERRRVFERAGKRELKLLYISPERLFAGSFADFLRNIDVSFFAVDEAHCVSMWGHDFRPEYRQLGMLKDAFPGISVQAFTATATEQVRTDIAEQLRLDDPEILVGSFDRPNLLFKVQQRSNRLKQVIEAIGRHPGESGIVYCLRRDDTEKMAQALCLRGYRAAPYHAGMEDDDRRRNQDAFINEAVDIIAATVAFGMGIDKSNVRYVLHAGMPKSLEHYQQESGRAGRDGLEAECTLLYSAGDFAFWRRIVDEMEPEPGEISLKKLYAMYNYCTSADCRHQALSRYFGQDLPAPCTACDVCLGFLEQMDDSLVLAQKILSCIMRLKQSFGADYTVKVLTGSQDKRILQNGHDRLSTYNLLSEFSLRDVRDWTEQLVAQGYAQKTGEYNVLNVTPSGWQVLKGLETPRLTRRQKKLEKKAKRHRAAEDLWAGVDVKLFEALKALRLDLSRSKGIPPFIIFSDASLRDMARLKPRTITEFLEVKGVGEMKKEQYGKVFLAKIGEYLDE